MAKLFKIENIQRMQGQDLLNRYYYLDTIGAFTAQDACEGFVAFVVPEIWKIQSGALEHLAVRAEELIDTRDKYLISMENATGLRTGEPISVFVNWAYQLFPAGSNFRTGRKAFAGVSESDQANGVPDAAMQTVLETLAPFLFQALTDGTNDLLPVLARYVIAQDIWKIQSLISVLFKRVSTQNTRKPYSGGGDIPIVAPNDTWTWNAGTASWDSSPAILTGLATVTSPVSGTANVVPEGAGTTWN